MKLLNFVSRIALWLFLFGLGANSLVFSANQDRMPVLPSCDGPMCTDYRHVIIDDSTRFVDLADIIVVRTEHTALYYSIGDLTMAIGLPVFLSAEIIALFLFLRQYLVGNGKGR